ncbi:MAG: YHS domain-containing protein [Smithellaceae bacterium]|nr:YHS domain-containing protein [Smithellaceae bacterium]
MIFKLLITIGIIYIILRISKMGSGSGKDREINDPRAVPKAKEEDLVEDPYCHVHIPVSSAFQTSIEGKTIYFCSKDCWEKFQAEK